MYMQNITTEYPTGAAHGFPPMPVFWASAAPRNVLGTVVGQSATDPGGRVTVCFTRREDGRSNNLPLGPTGADGGGWKEVRTASGSTTSGTTSRGTTSGKRSVHGTANGSIYLCTSRTSLLVKIEARICLEATWSNLPVWAFGDRGCRFVTFWQYSVHDGVRGYFLLFEIACMFQTDGVMYFYAVGAKTLWDRSVI